MKQFKSLPSRERVLKLTTVYQVANAHMSLPSRERVLKRYQYQSYRSSTYSPASIKKTISQIEKWHQKNGSPFGKPSLKLN